MADVNINKFRASVVRDGSKPASPGFIVSEGQDPVDPAGNGQNHLPVTIATAATGLSITDSQVLGGAGTVGQYIRGDGSLADFPQASGGGSSVSYYLNGSISQGTIGGVAYKELNKVPILGAGTDFTINADGYIASFLTDAGDPNLLEIPGGNWNFETYFSASSSGGTPTFYVELYKYDGTTFTLIASSSSSPELIAFGTNLNPYFSTLAVPTTTLALTDRLAVRFYVNHSGRTITLHTENNHLCQVVTTFTTGLTSLNGLTAQVQNLAVGTSGTDFNIASATATHTFNLPTASATNRGALSSADWTTFNNKQNALGYVPVPETRTITINGVSQDLSANRTYNVGTVTSVGLSSATSGVTIGGSPVTGVGAFTLAIATASGSQNGLLSSTDWTTFNGKQNALTNPVTGTGTTNYLPKFTGSTTIGNSNLINDANGNLGLAVTPSAWDATIFKGIQVGAANGFFMSRVDATDQIQIGTNAYYNADGNWKYINTNEASRYYQASGQHIFENAASGTAGNNITWTQAMTLFSTGNLLVGSPSPISDNGARLQVSGTATFGTTSNGGNVNAFVSSYGNNGLFQSFGIDGSLKLQMGGLGTNEAFFYTGPSNFMTFYSGGSERLRITSSGNVLIGTTTNNGTRLQVNGGFTVAGTSALADNQLRIRDITDANHAIAYNGTINGPLSYGYFGAGLGWTLGGSPQIALMNYQGNILIGTTSNGSSKLRIVGLPTSSSGLSSGDVWSDSGTLKIA